MSQNAIRISKGDAATALNDAGAVASLGDLSGDMQDLVIRGAQGQDPEDVNASRRDLFVAVYDRSASMQDLAGAVIEGQNIMFEGMAASKESKQFAVSQYLFAARGREELLHSFVPLPPVKQGPGGKKEVDWASGAVVKFDAQSYRATGDSTALRDAVMAALLAAKIYAQLLTDSGTPTKVTLVVFTDGLDNASKTKDQELRAEILAALKTERWHVAFVAFADGVPGSPEYDASVQAYTREALSWGLDPKSIKAVPKTASEARRMFELTSQSQIRASQGIIQAGPNQGFFT